MDEMQESELRELLDKLNDIFRRMPDGRPINFKTPEGTVWIKKRPNGISVVHTAR